MTQEIAVALGLLGFIGGIIRFEIDSIRHNRERKEEVNQLRQQTSLMKEQLAVMYKMLEIEQSKYPRG